MKQNSERTLKKKKICPHRGYVIGHQCFQLTMEKHCSFYSELNSTGTDNVMRKSPSKKVLVPFITSAISKHMKVRVKHAKKQFLIRNDQSPPVERKQLPEFCA